MLTGRSFFSFRGHFISFRGPFIGLITPSSDLKGPFSGKEKVCGLERYGPEKGPLVWAGEWPFQADKVPFLTDKGPPSA